MKNFGNKVMLTGNLGMDPVYRKFENGTSMARLSIATNEIKRNVNGESNKTTNWHNLIAWGGTADIIKLMLQKGRLVSIEGHLNNKKWKDKDGKTKNRSEIVIRDFTLLG